MNYLSFDSFFDFIPKFIFKIFFFLLNNLKLVSNHFYIIFSPENLLFTLEPQILLIFQTILNLSELFS